LPRPPTASPANGLALFLGRTLPAIANGFVVPVFCIVSGSLLLDTHIAASALPGLALIIVVCAFSCSALGLWTSAVGLRARNVIAAARDVVGGQTLAENGRQLLLEFLVGLTYAVMGMLLLRLLEFESRRTASLDTM
jgi:ABC-2 type transport system permease protein